MAGGAWTYRMGIVDGPSRAGALELDRVRLPLPVVLDLGIPSWRDPYGAVGSALDPRWKDIVVRLGLEGAEESARIPFSEEVDRALGQEGMDKLSGAQQLLSRPVTLDSGNGPVGAEIVSNALFPLISEDPLKIARGFATLKGSGEVHPPVFLPGAADADSLEPLLYLGTEVLDTSKARADSLSGAYYTMTGSFDIGRMARSLRPSDICLCPSCTGELDDHREGTVPWKALSEHNIRILVARTRVAEHHLREGTLRRHVMGLISGRPGWLAAIRHIEGGMWPPLLDHAHSWKRERSVPVTYRDDLLAPEFRLWAHRLRSLYRPPLGKDVLLFLPCSSRKPYSRSRTHQRITSALQKVPGWKERVHRMVLTSPLGAVPMELETLYPAAHYDIPVTGKWYPEEVELIRDLASAVLSYGTYRQVVCFHPEGRLFFREAVKAGVLQNIPFMDVHSLAEAGGDDPHEALASVLGKVLEEGAGPPSAERPEVCDARQLVRFSTGIDLSSVQDLRVSVPRSGPELRSRGVKLFDLKVGGPVPTLQGGELAWGLPEGGDGRKVIIEGFVPRGTVFAQGIKKAGRDIHPGDMVLIGSAEGFLGVGRALLPGQLMTCGRGGPAVEMLSHISR